MSESSKSADLIEQDDVLRCELESGKELARLLVEHVCTMGAASCKILITYNERAYVVYVHPQHKASRARREKW